MARVKAGTWSKYRRAQKTLTELQAQLAALQRSRPRTRGKKASKTRALNNIKRRIPAAKGLLTKARNAIAKAARGRKSTTSAAKQKRSDAAKRGWAKRRAGKASKAAIATDSVSTSNLAMPFLTSAGIVGVWPPAKSDRSKIGKYFSQVDRMLAHQPYSFDQFDGVWIYDEISGKRLPFITDIDLILTYSDEFHFGFSFYRDRHAFTKVA